MAGFVNTISKSGVFEDRFNLLIIDPQNDFIDAPYTGSSLGRLPVVNAKDDIPRISELIETHADKIDKIVVSMDTHTIFHIGHRFWRSPLDGSIAPPGTTFSVNDDGQIIGTLGDVKKEYNVNVGILHVKTMNKYAREYIKMVTESGKTDGRNTPCTWNVHCIQGTEGWKVHPAIVKVLDKEDIKPKVQYHIKGQNQLAEMYSIMKAEVAYEDVIQKLSDDKKLSDEEKQIVQQYIYNPVEGDQREYKDGIKKNEIITELKQFTPTSTMPVIGVNDNNQYNLQTTFNYELFEHLTENGSNIVVCGEALSHCVQFSTRDIVTEIANKSLSNKVYIIENASSPVNVDAIGLNNYTKMYKESADGFINDMLKGNNTGVLNYDNGVLNVKTTEIPNVVKPSTVPVIPVSTLMNPTKSSSSKIVNPKNYGNYDFSGPLRRGGKRTLKNNKKSKKTRKHRKKGGKRTRKH
jgi:nicotinamidase-related amidase